MKKMALSLVFALASFLGATQKPMRVISNSDSKFPKEFETIQKTIGEQLPDGHLKLVQLQLIELGYLSASVDSTMQTKDSIFAFVHLGKQYKYARLKPGNINPEISSKSGIREKLFTNKLVNPKQIEAIISRINGEYENLGYPFSRSQLKIDSIQDNALYAEINVNKGPLIIIDTLIIKGVDVNYTFFSNSVRIDAGDVYNQALINSISTRIKEISFLSELKPAEVVFTENKAQLYVYLKKKNANRFNGVLGILPDRVTGKITFTGELKLDLTNAFNKGESINFHWQKLQTLSQELEVGGFFPYIFNLPFGVGAYFDLYKRDSTYLEVSPEVEIRYQMKGANYFGIFYKNYQSRLIDPERFSSSTSLPRFNDTKKTSLGVSLNIQELDYRLNPRKGFDVNLKLGTGFKSIIQLAALDSSIYNGLDLRTSHFELEGGFHYYLPLLKRTTLMLGAKGSWLINDQIFVNEMYRLGGLNTIRGFDDQSLLASSYVIGTAEYRFLLEQNSYVYLFTDIGYYENKNTEFTDYESPSSFGAGISFQTKAGIFTINYALGKQKDTEFLLKSAKIHFGFINYF